MKHLGFALSLALLLTSCLSVPDGYVGRDDGELNPHVRTGLNLPKQVGNFYRRSAWEKEHDPYHVRVTYGYHPKFSKHETITVMTSRLTPQATLQTMQHRFIHTYPDATVSTSAARAAQPHFPGWNLIVFDYQMDVPSYPPPQRLQPHRTLIATKTFHDRTAVVQATCLYDSWLAYFLIDAAQFTSYVFPHPSSWSGYTRSSSIRQYSGK